MSPFVPQQIDSQTQQTRLTSNTLKNFKAPSYPVDDFGLEGADDADVVEDWMFLIQYFKGCGRLRGGEKTHGYCRTVNCLECVYVALYHCVCVPVQPLGGN